MDNHIFFGVYDDGKMHEQACVRRVEDGFLVTKMPLPNEIGAPRALKIAPPFETWTEREGLMYHLGRTLVEELEKQKAH
jgi:hypothetical protein